MYAMFGAWIYRALRLVAVLQHLLSEIWKRQTHKGFPSAGSILYQF